MKFRSQSTFGAVALLALPSLSPLHGQLIHRYSFDNPAGDASGASLTDSVSGANGVVQGAGALFTGTGLDLPGGSSDTAAYGDLPNGLVSSQTAVTFEGWVTISSNAGNWGRIFDFGSTEPGGIGGEVTGPGNTNGGGTAGLDYFFLSAARGGNYNDQRVEVRNEDPAGGGTFSSDTSVPTVFGEQIHFAVTWKDTGAGTSVVNYWRNGVQKTTNLVVNSNLADLNDVNNWLGRSAWLGDANLDATFEEFRIYEEALTGSQIGISKDAGPDSLVDFASDPDNDMIPTAYEDLYAFLNPGDPNDASLDFDNDGLTNLEEYLAGTAPDDDDSDDDGLTDGSEVNTHGTNPLIADSDLDGLSDGDEVNVVNTLPLDPDTDDDGINDGPEVAAGLNPLLADATTPDLIHRYTFDNSPGSAEAGAIVSDTIGNADGVIVGNGGLWTGTALTLPGGDGATADAAYVDLPNGLLSSLDHLTFEVWYTVKSVNNWGRVWDFGSTAGGEVLTGGTGATDGQDYFMFAASRGVDLNTQRFSIKNADPLASGGGTGAVSGVEEAVDANLLSLIDQEYHVVGVWTSNGSGGGQTTFYRDGVREGTRFTSFTPRSINDVNNWIGRSNWTGDGYLNAELNEFRIYDGAMNDLAAAGSFTAGPDGAPGAGALEITDITYNKVNDTVSLTFSSRAGRNYKIHWSEDLNDDFTREVTGGVASAGEVTTFGPFANPSPGATRLFFRVAE